MFVTQAVGSSDRLTPLHLPRHQGLLEGDVVSRIVPVFRPALIGRRYTRPVETSRDPGGRRDVPLATWKNFGHEGISLSRIGAARPRDCGFCSAKTVPAAASGLSFVAVERACKETP